MKAQPLRSGDPAGTNRQDDKPRFALTEQEAAAAIGISQRSLFSLRKSGLVRFVKLGATIRYTPEAIKDFLRANEQTTRTTD
jgi:hypothetical protein